jgi:hypothetical protein
MAENAPNNSLRGAILTACATMMRPIARFLVRNGIGFREFSEIAKTAIVDVVSQDYGIRGRKTNISRVAVLAGLTRKEVARIRRKLEQDPDDIAPSSGRPEQVLDAWYHLTAYIDADNQPRIIPFEGEEPSFRSLTYLVGGDIPPMAMLKELLAAGSVMKLATGELQAVSRVFIPDATDPESITQAGTAVRDLMTTINHNLFFGEPDGSRIERRVYGDQLNRDVARKFARLAKTGGNELLNKLNDWLADQEEPTSRNEEEQKYRAGLGMYFFEEDLEKQIGIKRRSYRQPPQQKKGGSN